VDSLRHDQGLPEDGRKGINIPYPRVTESRFYRVNRNGVENAGSTPVSRAIS